MPSSPHLVIYYIVANIRSRLVLSINHLLWFPGEGSVVPKRVIMHPKYNIRAFKNRNVSEFYDYDVALVKVNKSIPLSWKAR